MDIVSKSKRSEMMSRIGAKDTKPEMKVRSLLHSAGYRYSLHKKDLPGRPDICLPKHGAAIFVHGCFWHNHICRKGKKPKSNSKFWCDKLARNTDRDARKIRELKKAGWRTLVVWECQLKDEDKLKRRLTKFIDAK